MATLRSALQQRTVAQVAVAADLPRRSVHSVLEGHVPSVTKAEQIAAALGLEFYVGPPRRAAVPAPIAEALGLAPDATLDEAAAAIESLAAAALETPSTGPPSDMAPVNDRRVAEMMAALTDAWEESTPRLREDLVIRWRTHFPDLADRALSLQRVVAWLGWRVVGGKLEDRRVGP